MSTRASRSVASGPTVIGCRLITSRTVTLMTKEREDDGRAGPAGETGAGTVLERVRDGEGIELSTRGGDLVGYVERI